MAAIGRRNIWIGRANNSNQLAVQRAHAAERTAQSIAANWRSARNTALQNIHHTIDELTALDPNSEEFVVERLVPARVQPVIQSKLPAFLRKKKILRAEDEPFTAFEYANGYTEHASDPQRLRVGEILRGWFLPYVIESPDIAPSRIIPGDRQYESHAMIVVSDHRAWAGGLRPHFPGPADQDPRNMIGVIDNNYALYGDRAIEGISDFEYDATAATVQGKMKKLEKVHEALENIRQAAGAPQDPNQLGIFNRP